MFKGKKNDIKANWTYARDWCREQGGDLAVIDDQYENGELTEPVAIKTGCRLQCREAGPYIFIFLSLQTLCRVT